MGILLSEQSKIPIEVKTVSLGEILRNLLDERDVTQKQLADNLNIGASTLGNYIQDIREPDYNVLKDLATFFDVTTDYLLEHRTKITSSMQEDEILRIFRSLSLDQQELLIEQGKLLITHNCKKRKSSESKTSDNKTG